jgi:hypothetical protein
MKNIAEFLNGLIAENILIWCFRSPLLRLATFGFKSASLPLMVVAINPCQAFNLAA